MVDHLRYGDTFVKVGGAWLFAERNLYVDSPSLGEVIRSAVVFTSSRA